MNLGERLRMPANGFEDRGSALRRRPLTSTQVQSGAVTVHDRPAPDAVIRLVGCHVGSQSPPVSDARSRTSRWCVVTRPVRSSDVLRYSIAEVVVSFGVPLCPHGSARLCPGCAPARAELATRPTPRVVISWRRAGGDEPPTRFCQRTRRCVLTLARNLLKTGRYSCGHGDYCSRSDRKVGPSCSKATVDEQQH